MRDGRRYERFGILGLNSLGRVPIVSLTLLPAVDVANGRTVGLDNSETNATDADPQAVALGWQAQGAEWVHLVDVDAAFGRGSNADLLTAVIADLNRNKVNVELAGGIHDDATLERALATNCSRVVLATAALTDPAWCERAIAEHGNRIAMSLDVQIDTRGDGPADHQLMARGSTGSSGELWASIAWLNKAGCARYIVTDVSRDGRLTGPNIALCGAVAKATAAKVIASGGVSSISDLLRLNDARSDDANIEGAIVGKALYSGRFSLADALAAVRPIDADPR